MEDSKKDVEELVEFIVKKDEQAAKRKLKETLKKKAMERLVSELEDN